MLTLKAPIELVCNTAVTPSYESFYHRILGNYEVMTSGITGEDLLHVMTAPPEIYLGEGGMTSLVNNTQVNNIQESKLEIINNLLNRIVLEEDVKLTYQDRVYITGVLNKLGIQNVQQFMTQVSKLKRETNATEQLIGLYWNHLEELTQKTEEYNSQKREERSEVSVGGEENRLYLHEDIMNRLQTGAVYQILNNFYSGYNASSFYVSGPELQITEQKRTAANILLNRLESIAQGETLPLTYRHENYYETLDFHETKEGGDTVNSRITSAVLLNLIDNLYLNRFEKRHRSGEQYLSLENALYQTAENTIWRLQTNTLNLRDTRESSSETNRLYERQRYEQALSYVYRLLEPEEGEEGEALGKEPPLPEIQWRGQAPGEAPAVQPEEPVQITEAQETYLSQTSDTEVLEEQLQRINQQNIENYNRIQQLLQEQRAQRAEPQEPPGERTRRESLIALTDPRAFLEEQQEREARGESRTETQMAELIKLLPEQTRKIYERLEQYRTRPEGSYGEPEAGRNNLGLLLHDIQTVERDRELETEHIEEEKRKEQIREVSETALERWREQPPREAVSRQQISEEIQNIPLVHRSLENQINDEVLEQLMEQNRLLNSRTQVTETHEVSNSHRTEQVLRQENTSRISLRETEELNEMIQRGVQSQMNALSDVVYNKLEKRMQNEKRRRGY